jgi:hypothetical protein
MSFGLLSGVLAVYGMEICHVKMLESSDVLWRSGFMQICCMVVTKTLLFSAQ